jgi:topoisomerase-4 subunit A
VIASIEDAARKKKIKIKSIQDFTAGQIEIEIALAPDQKRDTCIQALYAFTQCEVSLSVRATVIRAHRPVDLDVEAILRENVEQLLARLKAELRWKIDRLEAEWHRKTLVQLFVEHRVYKRIEECKTADAVQNAVLDGLAPFREQLTRDVTKDDVEMLLGIPIKRISRFDIEKNKAELDQIVKDLDEAEKNIAALVPFAIRYLKTLLKTYGGLWPRRTEITSFGAVEMRALTARELTVRIDREKGYLGYEVEGETLFECSSYDKLVLLWKDGRYKSIAPPDKLFVDQNLEYAAVADRDRVMTAVYRHEDLTFMKKFTFGGMIQNKEYLLAPEGSQLLFFADNQPAQLFVKFVKQPRLKILQQIFPTDRLAVRGAGSKGVQMTSKRIRSIGSSKPRTWEDTPDQPAGFLLDF